MTLAKEVLSMLEETLENSVKKTSAQNEDYHDDFKKITHAISKESQEVAAKIKELQAHHKALVKKRYAAIDAYEKQRASQSKKG